MIILDKSLDYSMLLQSHQHQSVPAVQAVNMNVLNVRGLCGEISVQR